MSLVIFNMVLIKVIREMDIRSEERVKLGFFNKTVDMCRLFGSYE